MVIMPLHDLTSEDRLPLVVTLVDGTQVPITVTADKDNVDHQVNLFWDPEIVKYLRAVKNHLDRFWNLSQVRLTSATDFWQPFSKTRECAVRMEPSSISPGASGVLAIVADKSAFTSESGGLETLALQLIRDDGLVEAFVKLEPALARQ